MAEGLPQPVIFFVDNLIPVEDDDDHEQDDDNDPEAYLVPLYFPFSSDNVAAVYHPVLEALLGSPINRSGKIEAVYVNFPNQGWFHIDPQATGFFDNITQTRLENMIDELFSTGSVFDPVTNEEIWSRVNIANVLADISAYTHIIGCLSGESASDSVNYRDYISTTQTDRSYAFVLGEFVDGDIHGFVHQNVKDRLTKWGLPMSSTRVLCANDNKFMEHSFFACQVTK